MRIFVMIFAALLVAGGSGFYLLQMLRPEAQPVVAETVQAPKPVQVYVPAAALAAGSILGPTMLDRMPIDADAVTVEMIEANDAGRDYIIGSVALHPLPKGVPIARSAIVNPMDRGFLAAVLPQGKRAISIPLNEVGGIAGLVMPGDRVDIILTYSVQGNVIDAERDIRASETLLTNLRVLALDARMRSGENIADQVNPTEMRAIPRTATLEVTPQQAETLTLATRLGELSLVLNSVKDGGEPPLDDDDAAPVTAGLGGRLVDPAATRRALTLDSQVTSLLQRELALMGGAAEPDPAVAAGRALRPLPERITRVQVVRGISSGALEFSGGAAENGAAANGGDAAASSGLSLGEAVASIGAAD